MNLKNMILAAALTTAGLAGAEIARITAYVPFPFDAKGVRMPAGTYDVARSDHGDSITVRNRETGKAVFSIAKRKGESKASGSWVAFEKYGDLYFLTEVKSAASAAVLTLPASKHNSEMALTATPETVVVRAD
jgi:hypothetical protein